MPSSRGSYQQAAYVFMARPELLGSTHPGVEQQQTPTPFRHDDH